MQVQGGSIADMISLEGYSHEDEMEEDQTMQRFLSINADDDKVRLLTGESEEIEKSSMLSGIINLTKTILGAGMLGLSNAIADSGIIVGGVLLLISTCAAMFGLHLLSLCASLVKLKTGENTSYFSIAQMTFPKAAVIIDVAVAIKCFGVATSYLIVIGALLPSAVSHFDINGDKWHPDLHFLMDRRLWISATVAILFPITLLKKMDSLKVTSWIALANIVYIVIMVIYYSAVLPAKGLDNIKYFPDDTDILSALPTFVFAFTCHQNLFAIHNEGEEKNVGKVVYTSCGVSLIVYLIMGYGGYFVFGENVSSNILNEYPMDAIPVLLARIGFSISVAFSYPLQIHPCRASLMNIITYFFPNKPLLKSNITHTLLTLFICGCTYMVAFFLTDLGIVFSLVGATGSVTLCYILPGVFYVKLFEQQPWKAKKIIAFMLAVIGLVLMVNSIVFIFLNEFYFDNNNNHKPH